MSSPTTTTISKSIGKLADDFFTQLKTECAKFESTEEDLKQAIEDLSAKDKQIADLTEELQKLRKPSNKKSLMNFMSSGNKKSLELEEKNKKIVELNEEIKTQRETFERKSKAKDMEVDNLSNKLKKERETNNKIIKEKDEEIADLEETVALLEEEKHDRLYDFYTLKHQSEGELADERMFRQKASEDLSAKDTQIATLTDELDKLRKPKYEAPKMVPEKKVEKSTDVKKEPTKHPETCCGKSPKNKNTGKANKQGKEPKVETKKMEYTDEKGNKKSIEMEFSDEPPQCCSFAQEVKQLSEEYNKTAKVPKPPTRYITISNW